MLSEKLQVRVLPFLRLSQTISQNLRLRLLMEILKKSSILTWPYKKIRFNSEIKIESCFQSLLIQNLPWRLPNPKVKIIPSLLSLQFSKFEIFMINFHAGGVRYCLGWQYGPVTLYKYMLVFENRASKMKFF